MDYIQCVRIRKDSTHTYLYCIDEIVRSIGTRFTVWRLILLYNDLNCPSERRKEKKRENMEFPTLCDILNEWKRRLAEIAEFHAVKGPCSQNVRRVLDRIRELCSFLRAHEPAFRTWGADYLATHRKEIFVKWWTHRVSTWAEDQVHRFPDTDLPPNAQVEWDRVFGDDPATCFSLAYSVVKETRARSEFESCDDKTILAIHANKEHDDNGFFCDLCDEQDTLWRRELARRMNHSAHPLLNPSRAIYFRISRDWEGRFEIGDWSPPKFFGKLYGERGKSWDCYNVDEYKQSMVSSFLEGKPGNTPLQATRHYLGSFSYGWSIPYEYDWKDEYRTFLLLWDCVDRIEPSIAMALPILQEIENMF